MGKMKILSFHVQTCSNNIVARDRNAWTGLPITVINIEPLFQINNLATNQCPLLPKYSMHHAIQLNLPGTWCTGTSRSCQNIRSHTLASDLWHDSLFPQSAMNPHGLHNHPNGAPSTGATPELESFKVLLPNMNCRRNERNNCASSAQNHLL